MKLAWTFIIASSLLLLSALADAGDRDNSNSRKKAQTHHQQNAHNKYGTRKARHDDHRGHHKKHKRDKHHHKHNKHYRKHDKHQRRHAAKHHNKHHHSRHSDYLIGGLVIGSALNHAFHNDHGFCPDRRHGHRRDYRHSELVWSDYTRSCYRVKQGRYGEVYKEVPRRRCFR